MKKYFLVILLVMPVLGMSQNIKSFSTDAENSNIIRMMDKHSIQEIIKMYSHRQDFDYLSVDKKLFSMFLKMDDENIDPEVKKLFRKLKSVYMLEYTGKQDTTYNFYRIMSSLIDTEGHTEIMRSRTKGKSVLFLKKEYTKKDKNESNQNDNEFLVISSTMVISVRGDINIKTFKEIEEIMILLGDSLPF